MGIGVEGASLYFRKGKHPKERILEEIFVEPGAPECVNNADVIKMMVSVDVQNSNATAFLDNRKKGNRDLNAFITSCDCEVPVDLSPKNATVSIVLTEGQILTVSAETKTGRREVSLAFMGTDANIDQNQPNTPEKVLQLV